MDIEKLLLSLADKDYKNFHTKLIPTVNPDTVIGIRTPVLRKTAKDIKNLPEAKEFLNELPHKYYDENNLHAFLIEFIKDYDTVVAETERFLPYIDNWATCDCFLPRVFRKNTDKLIVKINQWIKSDKTYTIRYAMELLMSLYLDGEFKLEYADAVAKTASEEYYVIMMQAWYFATALAKQYDAVLPYFTENKLSRVVHNKAIQKAVESRRIDDDTKAFLKGIKR